MTTPQHTNAPRAAAQARTPANVNMMPSGARNVGPGSRYTINRGNGYYPGYRGGVYPGYLGYPLGYYPYGYYPGSLGYGYRQVYVNDGSYVVDPGYAVDPSYATGPVAVSGADDPSAYPVQPESEAPPAPSAQPASVTPQPYNFPVAPAPPPAVRDETRQVTVLRQVRVGDHFEYDTFGGTQTLTATWDSQANAWKYFDHNCNVQHVQDNGSNGELIVR